jgi:hypothetical protein
MSECPRPRAPRRYGEQPRSLAGRHVIATQVRNDVYLCVRELMQARNLSASGAVHHLLREHLGLTPLAPFDHQPPCTPSDHG